MYLKQEEYFSLEMNFECVLFFFWFNFYGCLFNINTLKQYSTSQL